MPYLVPLIGCFRLHRRSAASFRITRAGPDMPAKSMTLRLAARASFLSIALALTACERGRVISGPIDLSRNPVRISMARTGRSVGPTRQVCLTMSAADADSVEGRRRGFIRPEAHRTPIHVRLISNHSTVETLGDSVGADDIRLDPNTLCVWDHGLSPPYASPVVLDSGRTILEAKQLGPPRSETYTAMEIWSDRPVHVEQVRWWSGQRTGSP